MTEINEKNGKFLEDQLLNTGFGELRDELWKKIALGEDKFQLGMQKNYGDVTATATLDFSKSKQGYYFFNHFELQTKNGPEELKQRFKINKTQEANLQGTDGQVVLKDGVPQVQYVNSNFTLKEAYNLLAEKTSVFKDFVSETKEKYSAWVGLDFKNTDENGNFLTRRASAFDLGAKLAEYPIKELQNPESKEQLIRSLERGNARQSVTFVDDQKNETKMFIKVAPQFKSIDVFDAKMQRQRFVLKPTAEASISGTGKDQKTGQDVATEGGTNKKQQNGQKNEVEKKSADKTVKRKIAVRR